MSKRIVFLDTTLRDGEQTPRVNLNAAEKLAIAKQLAVLGVEVIEAGFAAASPGDFESVKLIAKEVRDCAVASLCRAIPADIRRTYEALADAAAPRIHIVLATSDIHMKYKLKMSRDEVLEATRESVRLAKSLCADVQFSAEDASRSDRDFLCRVFHEAIAAGAATVNITDTVGYAQPQEFAALVSYVREHVQNINRAKIAVHCHNDLGLAVANTLAGISAGAEQAECTINGLGERAGNAALEEVVMNIDTRKDFLGVTHSIKTNKLLHTSRMVSNYTGVYMQPNKAVVGENAFLHESGIHQHGVLAERSTYEIMTPQSIGLYPDEDMVLGKLSGHHAFEQRVQSLGYHLSEEELRDAFARFKELCDRKKDIANKDILAIVEGTMAEIPPLVELESYRIVSVNKSNSTAEISLLWNGESHRDEVEGDGPVDAAFRAIDRIVDKGFMLESYMIKAVTGGRDALGEVTVRVKCKDRTYLGRGISTDIIESSILAYVNAVNRALADIN